MIFGNLEILVVVPTWKLLEWTVVVHVSARIRRPTMMLLKGTMEDQLDVRAAVEFEDEEVAAEEGIVESVC